MMIAVQFLSLAAVALAGLNGVLERLHNRSITASDYFEAIGAAEPIKLSLETKDSREKVAPYYYGLMFEDISHSGDGGIYGELLMNRNLRGMGNIGNLDLNGWSAFGPCSISLDTGNPLSKALPAVIKLVVKSSATGECGLQNKGYWGVAIKPQTYKASFYVKAAQTGHQLKIKAALRSNSDRIWAHHEIEVKTGTEYSQHEAIIRNSATAPNAENVFTLSFDTSNVSGNTYYFGLVSLFGETFKDRKNGLRKDIAEAFHDMNPKFLRFPGGNNLEGISHDTRWKWYETIGPLKDRPGRPGNWGYYNTDGLGLLEYLEWCEDMQIEPVLAVYAGYALGGTQRDVKESEMGPVLQEALDELEYCMGSTSTKWGAVRARHGHPQPFPIKFVEIGNEDWFSKTYAYRWRILYNGLKARYPNITYISTVFNESGNDMKLPPGTMWDTHHYEEPNFFLKNFHQWDNWQKTSGQTGVGVLLGEYSVYQVDTPSGKIEWDKPQNDDHVKYPRLLSAIAEGIYALGGERNPHTVWMSSYAPSLQRKEATNWTPNMIIFDSQEVVLSPSYWQQWLFSRYRGTHNVNIKAQGNFNPLFWGATIQSDSGDVYLKIINAGAETVPLNTILDERYGNVTGKILTSTDINDFNFFDSKNKVVPQEVRGLQLQRGNELQWTVPRWSLSVLHFRR